MSTCFWVRERLKWDRRNQFLSNRVLVQNLSYENEFDLHENEPFAETQFHMNGFAGRLVLTERQKTTRKWPIVTWSWITHLVQNSNFNTPRLSFFAFEAWWNEVFVFSWAVPCTNEPSAICVALMVISCGVGSVEKPINPAIFWLIFIQHLLCASGL